jgi:hypothetical protein
MDISTASTIFVAVLHVTARIIWSPVTKFINATIILLAPLYNIITFILLPFIHLGGAVIRVLSKSFTVKWLERIEVSNSLIPCIQKLKWIGAKRCADIVRLPRNSRSHWMPHRRYRLRNLQVPVLES